jgi:serine/threonine-protein kinase
MTAPPDPDRTVDESPGNPLDAALAAAFGPDSGPPLPAGSVVRALGTDPVQLREPATDPADPVVKPHSDAVPAEAPPRLQINGEVARGGMGAVLKGRDTDLGRDVAVKVLLETHRGRTELVQRFVEEAQVTGQLQHPGVVPVYEMGQLPDERPYFTMKLVKGQTLAKLLAERTAAGRDRPRLLKVFEQVCQAVAYAHARGVIHRDLKPANVMVGAFGEALVMDWGLAKVLPEGSAADETEPRPTDGTVVRTGRGGSATTGRAGSRTQAGVVLGTPAYMAPEQARGEVDQLDERCDVFGLGGILCQILTGRPPYVGGDSEPVQALARRGDLADAFARLDGCGADAELVAMCRECLAPRREDRPREAGAVAARVAAYQAAVQERLRQAELGRAAAEARAVEERKRRRVSLGLAAAVLALVVVGAGGGLLVQQQAAARREDRAHNEAARREDELRHEAARREDEIRHEAKTRQAVEPAFDRAAELGEQARWGEAAALLEQAGRELDDAAPDDLRRRLQAAHDRLALVKRLDVVRQRRAAWVGGHFDLQAAAAGYAAAFEEAGLGKLGDDPGQVAARVRDSGIAGALVAALDDWAYVARDAKVRGWVLDVARQADPDPWWDQFRDPRVRDSTPAVEEFARKAMRDEPARLGRLSPQKLETLGWHLRPERGGVELLRLAQRRYPGDFWLNLALGDDLAVTNQRDKALGYFRAAVALRPDSAAARHNLGTALYYGGDSDGAVVEYRAVLDLDPQFPSARKDLGLALRKKGDLDGAIAEYKKAIADAPKDARDALTHYNLALALHDKADLDGAIAEYKKAIEIDKKLGVAHYGLGAALHDKAERDGTIADLDGAIAEDRLAIDLDPRLAAPAHTNLGRALHARNDLPGAISEYREAIKADDGYAAAHNALGSALFARGDVKGAVKEHRRAIELDPTFALAHTNLGTALMHTDPDAAIDEFRTAIKLDPDFPDAHCNLGHTLRDRGRFAEALKEMRRGHELGSKRPGWPYPSGDWVRECERLLALDEKLPDLLSGTVQPAGAAEQLAVAQLCQRYKHRHAAAAHFYADAFAADPRLAVDLQQQHRYNAACSAALAAAGHGDDAKALPDKVQVMLRRQALGWLRADMAAYAKLAERPEPAAKQAVRQRLGHWREDSDLAAVRDKPALAQLPGDEREAWAALWADVDALLQKVEGKK